MIFPSTTKRRFGAVRLVLEKGKRIRTVSKRAFSRGVFFHSALNASFVPKLACCLGFGPHFLGFISLFYEIIVF